MSKKLILIILVCLGCVIAINIVCDHTVMKNAEGKIFCDVNELPHNTYGLLLWTSPTTSQGTHDFYLDNRIYAATVLYNLGKIDYIIASSGDFSAKKGFGCNEQVAMRDSLIRSGIPENKIILDYGALTTNSVNTHAIDSITIISQGFQNERAIYIANYFGIEAIAFNALTVDRSKLTMHNSAWEPRIKYLKNVLREYPLRVKLFIDIFSHESTHIH